MKINKMIKVLNEAMELGGEDLDVVITSIHIVDEGVAVVDDPIIYITLNEETDELRIIGTESENQIEAYVDIIG